MAQIKIRAGEAVNGGLALGLMTAAGNPWTVSDAFAQELVNRGKADFVAAPSNPSGTLTSDEVQLVRGVVSGAGIGNPSSYYLACVPGRQFVTSGVPKDISANGADMVFGSALTDANLWANDGSMTFAALSNGFAYIPLAKASFNLATDSIIFSMMVNKAAPGATEYFCGNSFSGGNHGFRLAVKTTGKVQPTFTTTDGNFGSAPDTPCAFADGTNHVVMLAVDAVTKSAYVWRDGSLAMTVPSAYTGSTNCTTGVALAAQDSFATANASALKASGVHFLKFAGGGLPLNINKIAARLAARPYDFLTDYDIQR